MYDESAIEVFTTPSGLKRYRLPALYTQLNKHRNIASDTPEFAVHKAVFQEILWKAQHEHFVTVKRKKLGLEMNAKRPDVTSRQKRKIADNRTELAQQELTYAYNALANALRHGPKFSWDILKKFPDYPKPRPNEPQIAPPPDKPQLPREPQITDTIFQPKLDPMDRLMRSKREQKENEARIHFESAHTQWEQLAQRVRRLHQEQTIQYKQNLQAVRGKYQLEIKRWEQEKERYYRDREKCSQIVESKKIAFTKNDPHAILDFFDMVLAFSNYPPLFPQSYEIDYDEGKRELVIDYLLPPLKVLPRLQAVNYDKDADAFYESVLEEDERNQKYAQLLHEMPLRNFYEIFTADKSETVAAVQFRGYLYLQQDAKSGGTPSCVLAIRAERDSFLTLNLAECDPLDAFTELGGTIQANE
jgi:hypothetical protein